MNNYKRFLLLTLIFAGILHATIINVQAGEKEKPLNVILFIGDGMGLSQIYAAYTVSKGNLSMMKMPFTGFCITHSASDYITDSGAGGTALACGKKTYNGAIGVDNDTLPCKTILEYAEENGLSTGLVSTSAITHATPASFIAHQKSRENYEAIALDFLKTDIDIFIGGGSDHFIRRSDSLDLAKELTARGYDVFIQPASLEKIRTKKAAIFTAPGHNPPVLKGRGNMLAEATVKSLEVLGENRKGFFLMVEGSQIDWGGHGNDAGYTISEVIDMDKAVGLALAFAEKHGNTLVLVTADHETGGMVIANGNIPEGTAEIKFSTTDHTGVMVPVFASGRGAENFTGVYENTDIFCKILSLFNFRETCK